MKPVKQGPEDLIRLDRVQAQDVAAQPGGTLLAVAYMDHDRRPGSTVLLWDVRSQEQVRILRGLTGDIRGVAFSPDRTRLVCAGSREEGFMDGEIRCWDAQTWRCLWTAEAERPRFSTLSRVAFSPDGACIAVGSASTGGGSEKISLWDSVSGQPLRSFGVVHSDISCLAFSPDGQLLVAAASPDVTAWNPETGEARWSHKGHATSNLRLAFAPDGRTLTSCGDRTTVIWDAAAGKPLRFFKGHENDVQTVAFSADGSLLATGSHDGIRVWDVLTGKAWAVLQMEGRGPVWVGFWPDSATLTAVAYNLQIFSWDLTQAPKLESRVAMEQPSWVREDQGLVAAILEAPGDDGIRLVYSDWLEEHGQPLRAEFIRLQCELASLQEQGELPSATSQRRMALAKREEQILATHRDTWLEPLVSIRPQIDEAEFRRGFLWKLSMTGIGVTDEHLAALRTVPELEVLDLQESSVTVAGMVTLRLLGNLRHLILTGTRITVAGLAPLRELQKLVQVYNGDWGNEPNFELEEFKKARNWQYLSLPAYKRRAESLQAVRILANPLQMDGDGHVRSLSFSQCWTTDADLIYLRELPELESLDFFEDRAVTTGGLTHLQELKNLKTLCLCQSGVTDVEPLQHLTGLEDLDLSSLPALHPDSLRHLKPLKRLRKLSLFNGQFDDAVMPHLARLSALEELELCENNFTDEGLEQLSRLKKLKRLEVDCQDRRKDLLHRILK